MQYKIPYYLNFFVSIYKLFVTKNKVVDINPDEINPYKIAMFFENGMCDAVDQDMMDYGLPNESAIEQCKRLGILKAYKCPRCNEFRSKENKYICKCLREKNDRIS